MSLQSIFFDLDGTLIHSRDCGELAARMPTPRNFEGYHVWLRPSARKLLAAAASFKVPVYLCTAAERSYASGISCLFDLGIPERNILAMEHLNAGRTGLAPKAVLIDDLPQNHGLAQLKSRVLGIGPERFYQIPSFTGHSTENAEAVVQDVNRFLRRVSADPAFHE